MIEFEPRLREDGRQLDVFLDLPPAPKGNSKRARRTRFGAVVTKDSRDAKREKALTQLAYLLAPPDPLRGPILLDVVFALPIPSSWPDWKRKLAEERTVFPYSDATGGSGTIPDRGNLLKLLEDALEAGGWFANDSQVIGGRVSKCYGTQREVGYWVRLSEVFESASPRATRRDQVSTAISDRSTP